MIHAMIDLETLSTKPNATILTIGGVKFDAYTRVEPSQGMYHRIDVDSQVAIGRDVMDETAINLLGAFVDFKKIQSRKLTIKTEEKETVLLSQTSHYSSP